MRPPSIRRGDVFLLKPPNAKGKPIGPRFVAVIQNDPANAFSPATIVAAVRRDIRRGLPVHVGLPKKTGALPGGSIIDCGMLATVPSKALGARVAHLPSPCMERVDKALQIALSLD